MSPLLFLLASAWAGPSTPEIEAAEKKIEACRSWGCDTPASLAEAAQALHTLILADRASGQAIDPAELATIKLLDPELFERLPLPIRRNKPGEALPWASAPEAPTTPEDVDEEPEEPVADDSDRLLEVALASYRDAARASDPNSAQLKALTAANALAPLVGGTHDGEATYHLALCMVLLDRPAAALALLREVIADPHSAEAQSQALLQAVNTMRSLDTRRPLLDLIALAGPSDWDAKIQGEAWFGAGRTYENGGNTSSALTAYGRIDPAARTFAEGQYRRGLIYRDLRKLRSAQIAFRSAAEAGKSHFRDLSLLQLGAIGEGFDLHVESMPFYEKAALADSAAGREATLRAAWAAFRSGDEKQARKLYRQLEPHRTTLMEWDLLGAHIEVERAERKARLLNCLALWKPIGRLLIDLEADSSRAWDAIYEPDSPLPKGLIARVEADAELAAYSTEMLAITGDRLWLAGQGVAMFIAIDPALEGAETRVRKQSHDSLRKAIGILQAEVEAAIARAEAMEL